MASATIDAPADVRVTLTSTQYIGEHGGRIQAGTAVLVDAGTAKRWIDKGIARPAEETDKTIREQKLAEIERLRAEVEELAAAPAAAPVTRSGGVPSRRG